MNSQIIKEITMALAVVTGATLVATPALPEASDVTMTQAMDRLVTITYRLDNAPAVITLDVETNANANASADDTGWTSIGGKALWYATGDVWKKVSGKNIYTIQWRPDHSWPDHKIAEGCARAVVTAWALDNTPDYMVCDISASGYTNTTYYPTVEFLPGGILDNPDYRTTSIVMRKIMAKDVTWTMGSTTLETLRNLDNEKTHKVTLTNNYYIGVFPITQAQWDLIQPNRLAPSYYNNPSYRAMRPVEQICYNEIRMAANSTTAADGAKEWPEPPYAGSFLDLLHKRTGVAFDLPSEAQWEFAARAGNGDTKWGNGSGIQNAYEDENLPGRYQRNGGQILNGTTYVGPDKSCDNMNGPAIVGSYAPNSWGLYDTAGNVWEWCLDLYADDISALNGAVNTVGTYRTLRGGSFKAKANECRPAYRGFDNGSSRYSIYGLRVLCVAGLQ